MSFHFFITAFSHIVSHIFIHFLLILCHFSTEFLPESSFFCLSLHSFILTILFCQLSLSLFSFFSLYNLFLFIPLLPISSYFTWERFTMSSSCDFFHILSTCFFPFILSFLRAIVFHICFHIHWFSALPFIAFILHFIFFISSIDFIVFHFSSYSSIISLSLLIVIYFIIHVFHYSIHLHFFFSSFIYSLILSFFPASSFTYHITFHIFIAPLPSAFISLLFPYSTFLQFCFIFLPPFHSHFIHIFRHSFLPPFVTYLLHFLLFLQPQLFIFFFLFWICSSLLPDITSHCFLFQLLLLSSSFSASSHSHSLHYSLSFSSHIHLFDNISFFIFLLFSSLLLPFSSVSHIMYLSLFLFSPSFIFLLIVDSISFSLHCFSTFMSSAISSLHHSFHILHTFFLLSALHISFTSSASPRPSFCLIAYSRATGCQLSSFHCLIIIAHACFLRHCLLLPLMRYFLDTRHYFIAHIYSFRHIICHAYFHSFSYYYSHIIIIFSFIIRHFAATLFSLFFFIII